ncbi:MAG: two pore domain potassium channel family protein [Parasporobacterium sp.]|nr:two pore domain potassium channel family protein [Parasporobacterium sp.]
MKRVIIVKNVLKKTHTDRIVIIFVVFFLICALILFLVEPGIDSYWQALWYSYSVFSTAGFGDVVAVTVIGRIISVIITLATIMVVAVVTGVVVACYNEIISMQYKASKAEILGKLENLENLSKEELRDISERIKTITSK